MLVAGELEGSPTYETCSDRTTCTHSVAVNNARGGHVCSTS